MTFFDIEYPRNDTR